MHTCICLGACARANLNPESLPPDPAPRGRTYARVAVQAGLPTMDGGAHGLLSADPAVSPLAGWSKAHVNYCDGGSYAGNTSATAAGGAPLQFRGAVILEAVVAALLGAGTRHEPFNFTPMAANPITSGSPHVRPMGRTCGEPDEIKKNTHPKYFTALFREQAPASPTRTGSW